MTPAHFSNYLRDVHVDFDIHSILRFRLTLLLKNVPKVTIRPKDWADLVHLDPSPFIYAGFLYGLRAFQVLFEEFPKFDR